MTKRPRRDRTRRRLNEENVRRLPVRRRPYVTWDTGTDAARGLGVLTSPLGTKTFRVVFRFPGTLKVHGMKLGRVGEITLEEAREAATEARRKAAKGIDPKSDNGQSSTEFESAVREYVQRHQVGAKRNTTALEVQRRVLRACEQWSKRPVASITAVEIWHLLEALRDGNGEVKGKPYQANRVYSALKGFFKWAADPKIGKIKVSPMATMDQPFKGEKPRERFFNDQEIARLWQAANKIGGTHGKFLKALLLTGKRKGALSRMRWEQIDATWLWTPPKSEDKRNKRTSPAPIPSLLQRELGKRQAAGFVFQGVVDNTPYDPEPLPHLVRKVSGIKDFFPHALRHTAETKLAELKVPPHIRDLLFDHVTQRGAGGRYDHFAYTDEMREGIERWGDYVRKLVGPKVVDPKAVNR
jgi:integrase